MVAPRTVRFANPAIRVLTIHPSPNTHTYIYVKFMKDSQSHPKQSR
jgi:hypothetical protein